MKFICVLSLLIITNHCIYAQSADTIFFNAFWERVPKAEAMFYRLPLVKEGNVYKLSDFYMDGKKQMEGYSLSDKEDIYTGKCIFYDNGIKREEGTYENNVKNGQWIHYVPYIEEEILWYKENYVKGTRTGEFISYYENGVVKSKEVYTASGVTGKRYNEKGQEIDFFPFFIMPEFNGDITAYFAKNMQYPEQCRKKNIEGKVIVSFVVSEKGEIFNATVKKSAHPLLDKEALRLITSMPKWKPGKIDGELTHVTFDQPITFLLTD